jgi:hypothetical protein
MKAQRPEYLTANARGRPVSGAAPNAGPGAVEELAELSIEELEPRLTPDPFGHPSPPPPTGQVGWGC